MVEKKTGEKPLSWRTHAHRSDATTLELLEGQGIRVVSDAVEKKINPYRLKGLSLTSLPINVLPDHDHVFHGYLTEEASKIIVARKSWRDCFTAKAFDTSRYFELVKQGIERIEEKGGVATLLLHPRCMKMADDFKQFRQFCKWVEGKGFETVLCKEAANSNERGGS